VLTVGRVQGNRARLLIGSAGEIRVLEGNEERNLGRLPGGGSAELSLVGGIHTQTGEKGISHEGTAKV
jgi:hypothetical protein